MGRLATDGWTATQAKIAATKISVAESPIQSILKLAAKKGGRLDLAITSKALPNAAAWSRAPAARVSEEQARSSRASVMSQ